MIKEQRAFFGERKGYSSNNGRRLGEDQPEPVPMVTANDGTRSAIMGELTLCSQEQGKTESVPAMQWRQMLRTVRAIAAPDPTELPPVK